MTKLFRAKLLSKPTKHSYLITGDGVTKAKDLPPPEAGGQRNSAAADDAEGTESDGEADGEAEHDDADGSEATESDGEAEHADEAQDHAADLAAYLERGLSSSMPGSMLALSVRKRPMAAVAPLPPGKRAQDAVHAASSSRRTSDADRKAACEAYLRACEQQAKADRDLADSAVALQAATDAFTTAQRAHRAFLRAVADAKDARLAAEERHSSGIW